MKRVPMTPEQIQQAVQMRAEKMSLYAIGKAMHLSYEALLHDLTQAGHYTRLRGLVEITPEQCAKAEEMMKTNTLTATSAHMGLCPQTLRRALIKHREQMQPSERASNAPFMTPTSNDQRLRWVA